MPSSTWLRSDGSSYESRLRSASSTGLTTRPTRLAFDGVCARGFGEFPIRRHRHPGADVSLVVVLVVAAPPDPRLVAPAWRAVKPLVHAPEPIEPPGVGRVGVVDVAPIEHEGA